MLMVTRMLSVSPFDYRVAAGDSEREVAYRLRGSAVPARTPDAARRAYRARSVRRGSAQPLRNRAGRRDRVDHRPARWPSGGSRSQRGSGTGNCRPARRGRRPITEYRARLAGRSCPVP